MVRPSDARVGSQMGSYRLEALLGEGGGGRVYRARHVPSGEPGALKVIEVGAHPAPDQEERFRREARNLFKLKHPGVVGFREFGVAEGAYYLTVEYVEGADLDWVLRQLRQRNARMPVAEAIDIASQVARALDYVHRQGVIHGGVKPSNIILDRKGRAVLTDFGLGLSASAGPASATFGSAQYVSPEQALSSADAVRQSDIYSLGVILYEMLAGQPPFEAPTPVALAMKHMDEQPPGLRSVNPAIHPVLEAAVMRALSKHPADRYASGEQFAHALGGAGESSDKTGAADAAGRTIRQMVSDRPPPTAAGRRAAAGLPRIRLPLRTLAIAGAVLLSLAFCAYGVSTVADRSPSNPLGTAVAGITGILGGATSQASLGTDETPAAAEATEPPDRPASGASVLREAECGGYRFVSRLEAGMNAYAVRPLRVYDRPLYEPSPESDALARVVADLSPGDRVVILPDISSPNCYREARFWRVRTESGIVGWAHEWRFHYYLEP